MIGQSQYGASEYGLSGGTALVVEYLNLSDTTTPSDALEILIPLSLADVVGPSDAVSTSPSNVSLEESIIVNDWLRLEHRPANSPFQGV